MMAVAVKGTIICFPPLIYIIISPFNVFSSLLKNFTYISFVSSLWILPFRGITSIPSIYDFIAKTAVYLEWFFTLIILDSALLTTTSLKSIEVYFIEHLGSVTIPIHLTV
jgi:hypothetical protein